APIELQLIFPQYANGTGVEESRGGYWANDRNAIFRVEDTGSVAPWERGLKGEHGYGGSGAPCGVARNIEVRRIKISQRRTGHQGDKGNRGDRGNIKNAQILVSTHDRPPQSVTAHHSRTR